MGGKWFFEIGILGHQTPSIGALFFPSFVYSGLVILFFSQSQQEKSNIILLNYDATWWMFWNYF